MNLVNKSDIKVDALPGRGLKRIVGKNSYFTSDSMTVGYALYSDEFGAMKPHSHAEETVIITRAIDGYISWGDSMNNMQKTERLIEGMVLHIPENEWHVFHYEKGGEIEIIFIYGQSDNCRPEDKVEKGN